VSGSERVKRPTNNFRFCGRHNFNSTSKEGVDITSDVVLQNATQAPWR
jgi:hypothetical protein